MSEKTKPKDEIPTGIPPKSPVNRGMMSTGSKIPVTSYPGGEKTFLGCFQRVKIEGRRGRGYWEWKAAEMRRSKSGFEGDDEMTSIESDTVGRRSAAVKAQVSTDAGGPRLHTFSSDPPVEEKLGHSVSGGVRVLPSYLPYQKITSVQSPRHKPITSSSLSSQVVCDESQKKIGKSPVECITVKSYDQPRLIPPPGKDPPSKLPQSLSAGNIPSAPPKELLYADAESRRGARSQLAEGHGNQSVGYSDPSKYFRGNKQQTHETIVLKSDEFKTRNIKSGDEKRTLVTFKNYPSYSQFSNNDKNESERKINYASPNKNASDSPVNNLKTQVHTYQYDSQSTSQNDTLSSINSSFNRDYIEFEPETKPLLTQDSKKSENQQTNKPFCAKESRSTADSQLSESEGKNAEGNTSLVCLRQNNSKEPAKKSSDRRSGALVWVSQPGGGAKLEWVPTPGLSNLRVEPATPSTYGRGRVTQAQIRASSQRNVVAGQKSGAEGSTPKGIIKRGDEGGGGGGRERGRGIDASGVEARAGGSSLARAASDDPRAVRDGNAARPGVQFATECSTRSPEHRFNQSEGNSSNAFSDSHIESGESKNVLSSAPGLTRPAGRTNPQSGSLLERSHEGVSERKNFEDDKIVTVAGRSHGQTVRIRVRPEVHAYLSNLPVIRGSIGPPHSPVITARRDSIHSANSSSASGLTVGSGEGSSLGYQEQDYEAVVDEYILLKKAVDDHDPEALRLLTATEAALNSEGGGGGSEYPYLREMKERLLISKDTPLSAMGDPSQIDAENQLLEVHQTPVGTVVKLNADGYGSHTSPTHRVESFYTGTLESRKTNLHEFFPKNAKTSSFITLSMLYATLLVVVCLGFVLSEVLTHNVPLYYYEAFFTYLYGLSILFLLYVFCYLSGSSRDLPPKNQVYMVRLSMLSLVTRTHVAAIF